MAAAWLTCHCQGTRFALEGSPYFALKGSPYKESPVDVSFVIRRRLDEFGLEQRDLAQAAQVTESYISQLLTGKRAPPAPNRTDIYDKMDKFLKLPSGELARLADHQRKEQLKRELGDGAAPLFGDVRALILRKCKPDTERPVRAVFEKQPFGELERLVTQKLLDVVTGLVQRELENASWDIDLATFAMEVVLNDRLVSGNVKRFAFVELESAQDFVEEPGLKEFLRDPSLSGAATAEEVEFLTRLTFKGKRPTALYYYRELQNLRDPLHFASRRPEHREESHDHRAR